LSCPAPSAPARHFTCGDKAGVRSTQPHAMDNRQRRIRSFVRREGRLTAGQQKNLERLWPAYGLDEPSAARDWDAEFGRVAPRTLEIGFGAGEVLADLASNNPQQDFIGIEVYR